MDYVRPIKDILEICASLDISFLDLENISFLNDSTIEDFVYLLGIPFCPKDIDKIKLFVLSKFWFTYRKNFPAIGGTGPTSDKGWGCMMRCGQMLLAQAFLTIHLGRHWEWTYKCKDYKYRRILSMFQDKRTALFSIHQIAQMGVSEGKELCEWFGPNTIAQVLKKLVVYDNWTDLAVHVAMDNILISEDVEIMAKYEKKNCQFTASEIKNTDNESKKNVLQKWNRPLLIIVPLRLGLSTINTSYSTAIKEFFKLPQCAGMIGGRPNHALYFLGQAGDKLLYLDPHVCHDVANIDYEEDMNFNSLKINNDDDKKLAIHSSPTNSSSEFESCNEYPTKEFVSNFSPNKSDSCFSNDTSKIYCDVNLRKSYKIIKIKNKNSTISNSSSSSTEFLPSVTNTNKVFKNLISNSKYSESSEDDKIKNENYLVLKHKVFGKLPKNKAFCSVNKVKNLKMAFLDKDLNFYKKPKQVNDKNKNKITTKPITDANKYINKNATNLVKIEENFISTTSKKKNFCVNLVDLEKNVSKHNYVMDVANLNSEITENNVKKKELTQNENDKRIIKKSTVKNFDIQKNLQTDQADNKTNKNFQKSNLLESITKKLFKTRDEKKDILKKNDTFDRTINESYETSKDNSNFDDSSYHCAYILHMNFEQLDPSLALAFLCITKEDYCDLIEKLNSTVLPSSSPPLFEILEKRPKEWSEFVPYSFLNDSLKLKEYDDFGDPLFDSDDNFEILE